MMNSNLNLNTLPECKFAYRMVNSALLIPCIEYQRMLRMEKVSQIAKNFSEYIANEPKVSYRDGRFYVFDEQNTVEARRTCNGGMELPIRCKVFYGLTKEDEATLFAIQTGNATLIVATVTTRTEKKKNQPTHVLVDSNPAFEEPSMILLEQIFTIDKSRIERFMGYASKAEMLRIDMASLVSLALNVLSGNRSE